MEGGLEIDKEQAALAVKSLHSVFKLDSDVKADVKGDLPNI